MHQFKIVSAILLSILLAGCGGGGDIPAKPKFTSHVSFGDSLSDLGTYNVGFVAALGGGQFTINIPSTPTNWTQYVDAALGLPAACAAVTGLIGAGSDAASSVAVATHPGCTGYAQGGALVTTPQGIHNAAYGTYLQNPVFGGAELTYPVVTQIDNYLAANGNSFSGKELVSVVVGGNEVQIQLIAQTGFFGPVPTLTQAQDAMKLAATQLVGYVSTKILANGAKYVVVASIPDFADIPAITAKGPTTQFFVDSIVNAYNSTLKAGLAALPGSANVIYLDTYTSIKDEITNPTKYGLTNSITQVCDLNLTPNNRALFCTPSTLILTQTAGTHYLFADDTHPTPYGHSLFALYVLQSMTAKGWY